MDYNHFIGMESFEFLIWLDENFPITIPQAITTAEDMEMAAAQLLQLSSQYAYIAELASWFKVATRQTKRDGLKEDYEDMVDKRDAVDNKMKSIEQAYKGISRAVTIRTENNAELRMTGSKFIA
ncbi:MAG: hypothetical protein K6G10_07055 [Butyrivibrio sp.]|nr:hypothetical protein [Butyrivibrio sp.]